MGQQELKLAWLQSLDVLGFDYRFDGLDRDQAVSLGILLIQDIAKRALEAHQ